MENQASICKSSRRRAVRDMLPAPVYESLKKARGAHCMWSLPDWRPKVFLIFPKLARAQK